ncbi:MAG: DNA-binding protein [Synergistaceae bacterium]|nr:DNA-binding protein [Synergistaceae bacterium]
MSWENSVAISGKVHFLKGQSEGETGTGKYAQFAVRQDSQWEGGTRRDFLVVRVYDEAPREGLASKQEGDGVTVRGTLRSSRGSGVNYVRCQSIE